MATRVETSIGKRRHKRIKMVLPVKVSGCDAANNLISELAHTLDITPDGARLGAIRHPLKTGDKLTLQSMSSGNEARKCKRGCSLIELLIVVAIGMIAAAMALPLVSNAVNQIHLSSSATDYANLLQRARMRAVQDDTYYQIQTQTLSGDPIAYVDINKNGSYDTGEPMMVFASGVTYKAQSAGPALSNLKSLFLPSGPVAQIGR